MTDIDGGRIRPNSLAGTSLDPDMTDIDDLPFTYPSEPTTNGAQGAKPCRRHSWVPVTQIVSSAGVAHGLEPPHGEWCHRCHSYRDPAASRRGRANRSRGNRAELDVARSIPGGRKMGPLGLPWDVEVGEYARLQVKKLAARPGPAEVARLIDRIPRTGDRLRGFVWVEAAGRGRRGQRVVWFNAGEFARWHGYRVPVAHAFPGGLISMSLDDWCAEFVGP